MAEENTQSVESTVREIRRKTRKKYSAEEKLRIVLEGLRGEDSMNKRLCFLQEEFAPYASLRGSATGKEISYDH